MYYVEMQNGHPISATSTPPARPDWGRYETRNDWRSFERVQEIAAELTEKLGVKWIGTDAGPHTSPRYDVRPAPVVGAPVSYSFNGDSYPCGTIVSVSPTLKKVVTSDGSEFYRRRQTGSWIKDGTWSLISGHVSEQNPSF